VALLAVCRCANESHRRGWDGHSEVRGTVHRCDRVGAIQSRGRRRCGKRTRGEGELHVVPHCVGVPARRCNYQVAGGVAIGMGLRMRELIGLRDVGKARACGIPLQAAAGVARRVDLLHPHLVALAWR